MLGDRIYERARLTGEFRLRSGTTSSEYFDKYLFESDPRLLREIAEGLVGLLPAGVQLLAGLELGGVPLAVVASQVSELPTVFVRKAAKTYGTCRLAEGGKRRYRKRSEHQPIRGGLMTAVLSRTQDIHGRSHRYTSRHHSDADIYAGIARAWWLTHKAGEHHEHPMRTYLVRPGFAEEMRNYPEIDLHDVFAICARLITMEDFRFREIATTTRECEGLTEGLNPLCGLWLPLANTPELGIHIWQLVLVPIELRCIGPVDDPPLLEYGRFARGRA